MLLTFETKELGKKPLTDQQAVTRYLIQGASSPDTSTPAFRTGQRAPPLFRRYPGELEPEPTQVRMLEQPLTEGPLAEIAKERVLPTEHRTGHQAACQNEGAASGQQCHLARPDERPLGTTEESGLAGKWPAPSFTNHFDPKIIPAQRTKTASQ